MKYRIIATGSSGNAVLINDCILIDCGVSWRRIEKYTKDIKLVLLTHQHSDHYRHSTVKRLFWEHPAVRFGGMSWMAEKLIESGVARENIDVYKNHEIVDYGIMKVTPCVIPHDVPNCGYKIFMNGEKIFYATDCSSLSQIEAEDYDFYFVEGNYGEQEIVDRIRRKIDSGGYIYEYRARDNHLSKEKAVSWIAQNAGAKSRYVLLHEHKGELNV